MQTPKSTIPKIPLVFVYIDVGQSCVLMEKRTFAKKLSNNFLYRHNFILVVIRQINVIRKVEAIFNKGVH